jgi:hypothetical protein
MNRRAILGGTLLVSMAAAAMAGDDDPPRAPYFPPAMPHWLNPTPFRTAPAGHWFPRDVDWRSVDWSGDCHGCALHRKTQAHSLNFERKYVIPAKPSRRPWHNIPILEFVPDFKPCGPGSP